MVDFEIMFFFFYQKLNTIFLSSGSETWLRRGRIMDVPNMAVDMSSISVVRTAARLAPRTKPSESLWFATSWRLPLSEIFLTLLCTPNMYFQSCMPSCTTACHAPFTPKWSGTDPARPERTGKIISAWNQFIFYYLIFWPL